MNRVSPVFSRQISILALALASGLVLSACGQGGNASQKAANDTETATSQAPVSAPVSQTALWANGEIRSLDVQVAHPNGTVLQLTSIQSRSTETVIAMRVINGRDREIGLNAYNSRRGYLVFENGEKLYLSPPASNPDLDIPAGQTMEGELVFLGRLPASQNAVLILNENGSTDNQYAGNPGFRINLPLTELAGSGS